MGWEPAGWGAPISAGLNPGAGLALCCFWGPGRLRAPTGPKLFSKRRGNRHVDQKNPDPPPARGSQDAVAAHDLEGAPLGAHPGSVHVPGTAIDAAPPPPTKPLRGPTGMALVRALSRMVTHGQFADVASRLWQSLAPRSFYRAWTLRRDGPRRTEAGEISVALARLPAPPRVSLIMLGPENSGLKPAAWAIAVRRTVDSLTRQIHDNWELWLPADTAADFRDPRVKRRGAGLPVLSQVEGDTVALLSPGDLLPRHALALCVLAMAQNPDTQILYTDEEWTDRLGHPLRPVLKPAFDPDLLYGSSGVYPGQLLLMRTALARRAMAVGQQPGRLDRYRLLLEATHLAGREHVRHMPRVLMRRRRPLPLGGLPALQAFLATYHPGAVAEPVTEKDPRGEGHTARRVIWPLPDRQPVVSLLMPTRDRVDLLRPCVEAILGETRYSAFELLVMDHESRDPEALAYLESLRDRPGARVIPHRGPFNFADMMNRAAVTAAGEVLVFLNDDMEPQHPEWLRELVSQALRPDIGAVGPKVLSTNGTIMHGGIVLGLGNGPGAARLAGSRFAGRPGDTVGDLGIGLCAHRVSAVASACMAIRRSCFEAVGGFDADTFPIAFNDVDICLRLEQAGYATLWTPHAVLTALEPYASDRRERVEQERLAFLERWGAAIGHDRSWNPGLSLDGPEDWLALPGLVHGPVTR
ncbi:GT2 family glycosyltransferase [Nitrospirillum viridazoti]|nr:GT2 family glycosyltransferase [Nitrospirillum amazonense]